MNSVSRRAGWMCLWVPAISMAAASGAAAQSSKSAQTEAGEPRADTSAAAPASTAPAPAPASTSPAASPATRTPVTPVRTPASGRPAGAPAAKPQTDRVNLGTATVTGDREQPKVMYIVPWKRSDIGDLSGKPMNSLLDEALAPVDRDEFKREVVYYQAVRSQASQNGDAKTPAQQGEK